MEKQFEHTKRLLDTISPSMCFAKWKQTTLHLHLGENHSCHLPDPHHIPLEEIAVNPGALHNTKHKQAQQQMMLNGVRPKECGYCWSVQDSGKDIYNDRITKSSEEWALPYKDQILSGKATNPSYLEVSFSNVCNLKCSYCGPYVSSKWMEEIKQHGPYPLTDYYNSINGRKIYLERDDNPYVEAFWKWWPDLYKDLNVFRMTGGEPLLSKHTFKILDYVIENPNPNLELYINSNLCVPDSQIDMLIEKGNKVAGAVKRFGVYTSCEAYKEKANYIRFGMNYDKWLENCNRVLTSIPNSKLTIMSAYNVLCVSSFLDFAKDVKALKDKYPDRVSIDVPFVRKPDHLSISLIDQSLLPYMEQQLQFFVDNFAFYEINRFKRMFNVVKKDLGAANKTARADFCMFVDEHDRRRGTDFFTTFPELEQFYYNCLKPS